MSSLLELARTVAERMTPLEQGLVLVSGWAAVGGLFVLFFWFYRDYRVDHLRQRLFNVREELFDYALQGNISFTHPSYVLLRADLNGMIRFAHRVTVWWIIAYAVVRLLRPTPEMDDQFHREHDQMFENAPAHVRDKFRALHDHALFLALEQIFMTSIIAWAGVVPIVTVLIMKRLWFDGLRMAAHSFPGVAALIDEEASALGRAA